MYMDSLSKWGFKDRSIQKEPICEHIGEVDLNLLCEKVWPALAVIGGLDRGLRVDGKCFDLDRSY